MKDFLKFAFTLRFLKHLSYAFVFTVIILWIVIKSLDFFTLHGKSVTVPDFSGIYIDDLDNFVHDKHLRYVIVDSIFDSNRKKGTVVDQDPDAGTQVKKGRIVYLTVISKQPEQVAMPNLIDLTLRQAIALLETCGLKVGKLEYVPDIAKNAVLKQKYRGNIIAPGTMVVKGSSIGLVLGRGISDEKTALPNLIGKSRTEAMRMINEASLNVGVEIFDNGTDSLKCWVYKQNPPFYSGTMLNLGSQVDLWYNSNPNNGKKEVDNE